MGELLAIHGGTPVRSALLPYGRQTLDADDAAAVMDALRADYVTTGPRVDAFERALAARIGARYAVAMSSGTAALHAAVACLGVDAGDEVIVPPLTFAATANAVCYVGGTPVFADVRPDTLTLDPAAVRAALTPRTRAIVGVDFAGQPCDLAALREIAGRGHVALLDDAAHALGAEYRGCPVGTQADATVFSFHPVKHVTTAEGGLVATADDALARRLRRFRNHGITVEFADRAARGDWYYEIAELGFNYRLTDIQCALGLSQLGKLDRFLARREAIASRYRAELGALAGLRLPAVAADVRHAWHFFPVLLEPAELTTDRTMVFRALRAEGIGVNVHYIPVYWHPYYARRGYARGLCPVAEDAYARLVTLPLFPAMTDADADDVVAAVRKVLGSFAR
jgi:perosamine synthetase